MIKVGIVGGTGYTGVELLRLLVQHPQVEVAAITSRQEAGMAVDALFPCLRGRVDARVLDPAGAPTSRAATACSSPRRTAWRWAQARALLDAGVRIVDLSADFRLKDVADGRAGTSSSTPRRSSSRKRSTACREVNRDKIRGARLVANPGCYRHRGAARPAAAGRERRGRPRPSHRRREVGRERGRAQAEQNLMYSEASDNFTAYGVGGHRHRPEIRQGLAQARGTRGRPGCSSRTSRR